jgi:hypothetical protein
MRDKCSPSVEGLEEREFGIHAPVFDQLTPLRNERICQQFATAGGAVRAMWHKDILHQPREVDKEEFLAYVLDEDSIKQATL